jgi:hypothetical protein
MTMWLPALLMAMQIASPPAPAAPRAVIGNGRIRASVLLPDAQQGYYRGTRFDWSGAIESLTIDGHEYFGQWFDRHDPTLHDAIPGPVEEFVTAESSSVGYEEAGAGERFVRIGVGAVRRPAGETAYRRFATYEIVDPGRWTIETATDAITFTHLLGETNGYAYTYRKVLRLEGDRLIIDHELRNTGRKPIVTRVYNHNFFTLDRLPTGPAISIRFPFALTAARDMGGRAAVRGREIAFLQELQPGQSASTELTGFGATAADYDVLVEQRRSGARVRIRGDRPIVKLIFWSAVRTVCPEPYIDANAGPGESATWRIEYTFGDAAAAGGAVR